MPAKERSRSEIPETYRAQRGAAFMVPADSDDILKDYEILLNELKEFNPNSPTKQGACYLQVRHAR